MYSVEFQKNKKYTEDQLVDSNRVVPVVGKRTGLPEELCANSSKTEVASLVQLEYIYNRSLFMKKALSGESPVSSKSTECIL